MLSSCFPMLHHHFFPRKSVSFSDLFGFDLHVFERKYHSWIVFIFLTFQTGKDVGKLVEGITKSGVKKQSCGLCTGRLKETDMFRGLRFEL